MSYNNALRIIKHEKIDRPSQWEWVANPAWVRTKMLPNENMQDTMLRLYQEYDWDFGSADDVLGIGTGSVPAPLKNVTADMIYDFDPENPPEGKVIDYVQCLGVAPGCSAEQMAEVFHRKWHESQSRMGSLSLVPGAHYHQVLHYFTTTFGWEPTMYAAYDDPNRFEKVMDRFTELTVKVNEAWAMTGVRLMICHDDLAMIDRTIFPPDWYREYIFPRYKKCWEPLKKKGIAILFMSDGKIDALLPDLMPLEPDGLFIDAPCDLLSISEKYGSRLFLIGNVNVSALIEEDAEKIKSEIRRVVQQGASCENLIIRCSSGLDENIPPHAIQLYMDAVKEIRSENNY